MKKGLLEITISVRTLETGNYGKATFDASELIGQDVGAALKAVLEAVCNRLLEVDDAGK